MISLKKPAAPRGSVPALRVRGAQTADLDQVVEIDAGITGLRKAEYWGEILRRYGGGRQQRFFLVADRGGRSSVRLSYGLGAAPAEWTQARSCIAAHRPIEFASTVDTRRGGHRA